MLVAVALVGAAFAAFAGGGVASVFPAGDGQPAAGDAAPLAHQLQNQNRTQNRTRLVDTAGCSVYVTPEGDSYTVSNLSVPASATVGDEVTVTAEVSNPNDWAAVQHVDLRVDGAVAEQRAYALNAGETDTVTFALDTANRSAGTYSVGVFTDADGATTDLSLEAGDGGNGGNATVAAISFQNQTAGTDDTTGNSYVVIENVTLPDGGFVTIYDAEALDAGDAVGSVVGVTDYLEPGSYENVQVVLFDVPGAEFNRTTLTETTTLVAMPNLDSNANAAYDFVLSEGVDDRPYTVDGFTVRDVATVTVQTDNGTTTTTTTTTSNETTTATATTTSNETTGNETA